MLVECMCECAHVCGIALALRVMGWRCGAAGCGEGLSAAIAWRVAAGGACGM